MQVDSRAFLIGTFVRYKIWILSLAVLGCVLIGGILLLVPWAEITGTLDGLREAGLTWLRQVPVPLYLGMFVVLPLFGTPVSLFYFTAIPVLGGPYGLYGITGALISIGVSMSLAYSLANGLLRPFLSRWMKKRGYDIPVVKRENEWKIILLMRLSPFPYLVQNYSLGLSGCRYFPYILISWPIQGLFALGFMLMGESFAGGGMKYALLGMFLLVTCFVLTGMTRTRLQQKEATPA